MIHNAAVVLGATAGVGNAIARTLWPNHIVIGLHRGNHKENAAELSRHGDGFSIEGDAGSTYEAVQMGVKAVNEITATNGVKVLIHSLSGASVGSPCGQTPKQIERTFNLLAHSFFWWATSLWLSGTLAPDARVIALSNPCVNFYLANNGVIGAAKAALEAYVRTLAVEMGGVGIRVNALRFGAVKTPALEKVMPEAMERLDTLHESIAPSGRMQTPDDVAQIVKAMLTREFGWVNGAVIDGTGGCVLKLMNHAFTTP